MLAIELEFLTERYAATQYNDRDKAEWPPHPARLFSALVDTWAEDDAGDDERAALEWLERQAPPLIQASGASARTVAPVFVPVNDVQTVSEPTRQREKLAQAEANLSNAVIEGDAEAQAKARKSVDKAAAKLAADSKKAASATKSTDKGIASARQVLPESRMRQARTFPVVIPERPTASFVWSETPEAPCREALSRLCARLIRVGHSSSMVRAVLRVVDSVPPESAYTPDPTGEQVLRVTEAGQLSRLIDAHRIHQGIEPRVLPSAFQAYRRGTTSTRRRPPEPVFGRDWIVLERVDGPRLPIVRAADVSKALRGALLRYAEAPVAEVISGHQPDQTPSTRPHLAFVALPFVGSEYARGDLLGAALVLPAGAHPEERRAVARAIGRWEQAVRDEDPAERDEEAPTLRLTLGRAGVLLVRRVAFGEASRSTLRPRAWCRASRLWMTTTPIALDRNPGDLYAVNPARRWAAFEQAEATVAQACLNVGLPKPEHVEVIRSATLPGTTKPRAFPPFPSDRAKTRRVLVHARIVFTEPVQGPLLLGAGRYAGLGLCRPVLISEAS